MGLTPIETAAAHFFYGVSVQSAFALEDPNDRFAKTFNNPDAAKAGGATSPAEIQNRVYKANVTGGEVLLETGPKNVPAMSQVLMRGGRRDALIDALMAEFDQAEHFSEVRVLDPLPMTPEQEAAGAGNKNLVLVIHPDRGADHDVAVLCAWGPGAGGGTTLELSAWPIDKETDPAQ